MAYNEKTGIMTAPISIQEIKKVLGEATSTLAPGNNLDADATIKDLCSSDNINMWSATKPCRYDSLNKMLPATINGVPDDSDPNKENIIMGNQVQVEYSDRVGTIGIILPSLMKCNEIGYYRAGGGTTQQQNSVKFRLDVPTGYDGTHYYVSRLADFDGYNHLATPPFKMEVYPINPQFQVEFKLNTRDYNSVLANAFNYGIYKNVIWRLGVVVGSKGGDLSNYKLYLGKDSTVAKQESFLKTNGFVELVGDTFTISGSIPTNGGTYNFIGVLVAYKVTQSTPNSENEPIVTTISHVRPSSTDTSYCGIALPCAIETYDFSYIIQFPTVSMQNTTTIGLTDLPTEDSYNSDILNDVGDLCVYIDVIFRGGDDPYIYTGSDFNFELRIDGKSFFYKWLGSVVLQSSSTEIKKRFYLAFSVKWADSEIVNNATTHGVSIYLYAKKMTDQSISFTFKYYHNNPKIEITNKV